MTSFAFRFDPRYVRMLALAGIRPERAGVDVGGGILDVRFGPWHCTTTLDNVAGVETTGPFKAIKAIGPRLSLADRGLTFGTNTQRAVCIRFRDPVPGIEPTGVLKHPGLTVTVDDVDGLAAALSSI